MFDVAVTEIIIALLFIGMGMLNCHHVACEGDDGEADEGVSVLC